MKYSIDVQQVWDAVNFLKTNDVLPLEDVYFILPDGSIHKPPLEDIADWKQLGLSNVDFVTSDFYFNARNVQNCLPGGE